MQKPAANARSRRNAPRAVTGASCAGRAKPPAANDGDSFHVSWKGGEYIIRLYFVDAPEMENEFPERVREQAEYFGLNTAETLRVGKIAATFTHNKLAGRSFSVFTRWQNARGQSRLPRYYGFVVINHQNLCEELIAQGLARIFGSDVYLPDDTSPKAFNEHLRILENKAKQDHRGAWSVHKSRENKPDDSWNTFFRRPASISHPDVN